MTNWWELLDSRMSFTVAALVVSWLATAYLALIAANLHVRVRALEQAARRAAAPATAYARLHGRSLRDDIPVPGSGGAVVLFVSQACSSCRHVLAELAASPPGLPVAVAWTDGAADPLALPSGVALVPDGPRLAAELGVQVRPFALVLDHAGVVLRAGPVTSLRALDLPVAPAAGSLSATA